MERRLRWVLVVALIAAAPAALAERVFVKARGEIDLAPFQCESIWRGANVKRVCYDEREKYMLVSLKGVWYHYCAVMPATVTSFKRARAPGRYYNDNIRGNFDCETAPSYK
jgi:hypothetical protein